ncbi:hypothetical protein ANACOL_02380 [Anaerotruncus colihominis DSM 17241]|uniref:Lipoprotein n=1 Tax=Anaerotruncus colihominis DSM 17241 TaxID=445972 RepID=B0PC70_9FIRM|nr:hypothetical protein ANACOL_02380 [Anaerotruncus colihominis DSM 17241]
MTSTIRPEISFFILPLLLFMSVACFDASLLYPLFSCLSIIFYNLF